MDRFARLHTSYLAAPEYPGCRGEGCRNDHLNDEGYCADCATEAHVEAALATDTDAALGIGAATELPLTPDQQAEVDHLVRLSRNDSAYVRRAAERQVRLYPQFYPAVRA